MKAGSLFITATAALALIAAALVIPASAGGQNDPPNLSGTWKLDAAHSDSPQKMMGGPGRGGPPEGREQGRHGRDGRDGTGGAGSHDGAGRPGNRDDAGRPGNHDGADRPGSDGGRGSGDPMRGPGRGPMHGIMRVPDRFAVVQLSDRIELRDSLGVVVQRVLIQPQGGLAPVDSAGIAQLAGAWKGQSLEAQTEGPRGGTLQMTYELTDGGKTLKITTRVQPPGDRPAFDFTRVYERVNG